MSRLVGLWSNLIRPQSIPKNASPHGAITDIAIANVMALISSKGGKVSFGVGIW
jgi:hypothetical protein